MRTSDTSINSFFINDKFNEIIRKTEKTVQDAFCNFRIFKNN